MSVARKSLVAGRAIRKGEILTAADICVKRPGSGRSPFDYWAVVGQPADRDYQADDLLD